MIVPVRAILVGLEAAPCTVHRTVVGGFDTRHMRMLRTLQHAPRAACACVSFNSTAVYTRGQCAWALCLWRYCQIEDKGYCAGMRMLNTEQQETETERHVAAWAARPASWAPQMTTQWPHNLNTMP